MARGLRGVRDDLTELGRHLADIVCFLQPLLPRQHALAPDSPPPSSRGSHHRRSPSPSSNVASDADAASDDAPSVPSWLSVSCRGGGNCEEDSGVGGVTDEVIEVARSLAQRPEAWMEFAALEGDDHLAVSRVQREHIAVVEQQIPDLVGLHQDLVPSYMSEESFWKIYLRQLNAKLTERHMDLIQNQQDSQPRHHTYSRSHVCEIESEKGSEQEGYQSSDACALPETTSGQSIDQWVLTKSRSQQSMDQWSEVPSDVDSFRETKKYISSEESSDADGTSAAVQAKLIDTIITSRSNLQSSSSSIRTDHYRRKPPTADRRSNSTRQPNPTVKISKKNSWHVIDDDSEFEMIGSS